MIYSYAKNSACKIEPQEHGNCVMVTQTADSTGISITNYIEHIALYICNEYGIRLKDIVLVEHYTQPKEIYRVVVFKVSGNKLVDPRWEDITKNEAYDLMGW